MFTIFNVSGESDAGHNPMRVQPKAVNVSKCVSDRVSMIHKLTAPKEVGCGYKLSEYHWAV